MFHIDLPLGSSVPFRTASDEAHPQLTMLFPLVVAVFLERLDSYGSGAVAAFECRICKTVLGGYSSFAIPECNQNSTPVMGSEHLKS